MERQHAKRDASVREVPGPVGGPWGPLLTRLRDAPAGHFGENLPGRFRIFEIDGTVLPVLVMEPTQPAAAVCSNLSRYVHYPLSEARRQCSGLRLLLLEAGAAGWGLLLSALRVDRAIFINNHLLSHNPIPGLEIGRAHV